MVFILVVLLSIGLAFLLKHKIRFNHTFYAVLIVICIFLGVYIKYYSGYFVEYGHDGWRGIKLTEEVKLYESYEVGNFLERKELEQKWVSDSVAINYEGLELFFLKENEVKRIDLKTFEEYYSESNQTLSFENITTLINKTEWQFYFLYLVGVLIVIGLFFVLNGKIIK